MRSPSWLSSTIEKVFALAKKAAQMNQRVFWLGVVLLAFLSVLALSEPIPGLNQQFEATATPQAVQSLAVEAIATSYPPGPTATNAPNTPTPFPPELVANREQTNGIIIGTVVLVLIVIGGTLSGIRTRSKE